MPITLYYALISASSRGALLAARTVGVDVNIKITDPLVGDHLKPEYLRLNPEHTVPTLDDNGFIIWDSHVIAMYLANTYSKDDSLYPRDPKKRALVDERLLFNATTLFPRLQTMCFPVFTKHATTVDEAQKTAVREALGYLDNYLPPSGWVAGERFTIADCLCVTSVSNCSATGFFDLSKYKNINAWLDRCRSRIPDYVEVNQKGAEAFKNAFLSRLQRKQKHK